MGSVRVLFVAYLSLVGLGLVYFALLGSASGGDRHAPHCS